MIEDSKHYSVSGSTVYVSEGGTKAVYFKYESSRKGVAEAHATARVMNRKALGLKPNTRKRRNYR